MDTPGESQPGRERRWMERREKAPPIARMARARVTGSKREERKLTGIPLVGGKGVGRAHFVGRLTQLVRERHIGTAEVGDQIMLFNEVRSRAREIYRQYAEKLFDVNAPTPDHSIMLIYEHVLDDPAFVGQVVETLSTHLITLEAAIKRVSNDFVKRFDTAQTSYFKERSSDVVEICEKLISLIGNQPQAEAHGDSIILVVPGTFIPSDILSCDMRRIRGIAAFNAGTTSHAAIIARAHNIPLVCLVRQMKRFVRSGMRVMVDGYDGLVVLNPGTDRLASLELEKNRGRRIAVLRKKWNKPVFTTDGVPVTVSANVVLPEDISRACLHGADGVGLVRSEFFYFSRPRLPSPEDQLEYYRLLFGMAGDMHLTIRLLDIGGDKVPRSLKMAREFNPFMGRRGIRVLLAARELFEEHLTAIMRAAGGTRYSLMVPMVSIMDEWKSARKFIAETARKLSTPAPPCGMLFEVPSAVMEIETFLPHLDFASVGTNDLIQYFFAADRNNPSVTYLHNPLDHSFLGILKTAIYASANAEKPLSICGEMAGFPQYTALLLGLGLRHFSTAPHRIPAIKELVSHISFAEAREQVTHLTGLLSREEIRKALRGMNRRILGKIGDQFALFCAGDEFSTADSSIKYQASSPPPEARDKVQGSKDKKSNLK